MDDFIKQYKKFKLPNIDKLLLGRKITSGSGGSSNLIYIKPKYAFKIIPNYRKEWNSVYNFKHDQEEIQFYKKFTKDLILKHKTPHIVGFYKHIKLNIDDHLKNKNCPKLKSRQQDFDSNLRASIREYQKYKQYKQLKQEQKKNEKTKKKNKYQMKSKKKKKSRKKRPHPLCDYSFANTCSGWRGKRLKFDGIFVEMCPTTISDEFQTNLSKITHKYIEKYITDFIDRVVFQYCYTMCAIYSVYPSFVHNDMFLRNILAINNTKYKPNDYIKYTINLATSNEQKKSKKHIKKNNMKKIFYLPANGVSIKLNDFGYSFAFPQIGDKSLQKGFIKDIQKCDSKGETSMEPDNSVNNDTFNFLHDLYDGADFGQSSLSSVIKKSKMLKKKKDKLLKIVKSTCHKYIDTTTIDKINKYNRPLINWVWSPRNLPLLHKTVFRPQEYFNMNIFDKYTSIDDSNYRIVASYEF